MHPKLAERVIGILRDKKLKEGTPAATEYVKRVCHGADPDVWDILRAAQAKAAGWNMEPDKP
jgi:hypothetical protein